MLTFIPPIALWRQSKGMTQEQLAFKAGIPRPNLSAIEKGHRDVTLRTLYKIASALEMTPGKLIDERPLLDKLPSDRHEVDRLAKAILSGERTSDDEECALLDNLASLIINRLEAFQAPGTRRVRRRAWDYPYRQQEIYQHYGKENVKRILERVGKYLC